MTEELKNKLELVDNVLKEAGMYRDACGVIYFDYETICPEKAMEHQGDVAAFIENQAYKLMKGEAFIEACEYIYDHKDQLEDPLHKRLAELLHRERIRTKNIDPEMAHEFSLVFNKAHRDWLQAKEKSDYSLFKASLKEVRDVNIKQIELRDERKADIYDEMLNDFETGMSSADLDECFGRCKERLIPFLEKIQKSGKIIRSDFLSRKVPRHNQEALSDYLLNVIGFDFTRGAISTTEHPFTSDVGRDDIRVTTHYYDDAFASSMYSVIHEGGHALFGQLVPPEDYDYHIDNAMTMGMHESVSRFYENRIGRSESFINLVFDKTKELLPGVLDDVTPRELYEAVNIAQPSLIRTEADEFTYTFHIIIRYELEKEIVSGRANPDDLPELWNSKYEKYLGIRPDCDKNGILQDVHWTGGFGYFPTYAIGNMYNAMYYNAMKPDLDPMKEVAAGNFAAINNWMKERVFKKADRLDPKEWIRDITGRAFTPDDFLDYLEEKYGAIYGL